MNMESMYAGLYISVPGFSDMTWDDGGHGMTVYNPEKNECVMRYIVEASGKKIAESKELMPGEGEKLDFTESNCFLQKMINYIRSSLSFVQNKIGMYQFYGSPKEICL